MCICMFLNNFSTRKLEYCNCNCIFYTNLYNQQLIKAYREFMILYDICITLYTIYDKTNGTAHGRHFPDPYRPKLSYQSYHFETIPFILTNHSPMKLSSIL